MFFDIFELSFSNCKQRFFLDFILINTDLFDVGHANGLLIDKLNKRIYHFEPNGKIQRGAPDNFFMMEKKVNEIVESLPTYEILEGYTVVRAPDMCPGLGLQALEDRQRHATKRHIEGGARGYCMVWVMIFLHYCITNPDVSPEDIVTYLLAKGDLVHLLRQYVAYVVDVIQE